jgi:hypothetical protein
MARGHTSRRETPLASMTRYAGKANLTSIPSRSSARSTWRHAAQIEPMVRRSVGAFSHLVRSGWAAAVRAGDADGA